MNGINILNKEMIMEISNYGATIIYFCMTVIVISLLLYFFTSATERFETANVCFWTLVLSGFVLIITLIWNPQTETGRYRYEVTIDNSVSFVDLFEKYDVIKQNGRIWTLEDK